MLPIRTFKSLFVVTSSVLALFAAALCAAYLAYSFEFFLTGRFPNPLEVRANLPLIAVSDLHVGHPGARSAVAVGRFAERVGARSIIVAGDAFEKRRPFRGEGDAASVFAALGSPRVEKLLVTLSSRSHDLRLDSEFFGDVEGVKVLITNRPLLITAPPLRILVLHGDIFCKNGFLASLTDRLLGRLTIERAARRALGLKDEWLLVGHTHLPAVDPKAKVANPGCWKDYWRSPATMTAVLFMEDGAELVELGC